MSGWSPCPKDKRPVHDSEMEYFILLSIYICICQYTYLYIMLYWVDGWDRQTDIGMGGWEDAIWQTSGMGGQTDIRGFGGWTRSVKPLSFLYIQQDNSPKIGTGLLYPNFFFQFQDLSSNIPGKKKKLLTYLCVTHTRHMQLLTHTHMTYAIAHTHTHTHMTYAVGRGWAHVCEGACFASCCNDDTQE